MSHDITDPMAPMGYQCGDAACKEHGVARFTPDPHTEPRPGSTAEAVKAADDFEDMLAGFDRIIHDKDLQRQLLEAGLLVRIEPEAEATPRADAPPLRAALIGLLNALNVYERNWLTSTTGYGKVAEAAKQARTALSAPATPAESVAVERLARAIEIEDDRLPFLDAGIESTATPRAVAEQIADRYARLSRRT